MTQQAMDIGAPALDDDALARQHARRNGWTFRGWHTAVDLIGGRIAVAEFLDGKGRYVQRTIDALRMARDKQG